MMARLTDAAEIRLALVVGNDEFKSGKLATPPNDTGLMADALTTARFIVTRRAQSGSGYTAGVVSRISRSGRGGRTRRRHFVYRTGFSVQFAGDFVPVDADLARDVDVPLRVMPGRIPCNRWRRCPDA